MGLNGIDIITPTSIAKTGASSVATINAGGSVTFSLCESLSLNGVFTSSYDNYMIAIRFKSSGSGNMLQFRMRASGTDNSTASSYVFQSLRGSSTTVSASRQSFSSAYASTVETTEAGTAIYVFGPCLAQPTVARSITALSYNTAEIWDQAITHNQSTSYDGITLIPAAGNITGLLTVYGLVK